MIRQTLLPAVVLTLVSFAGMVTAAPEASITVDTKAPGIDVSPTLYGLFFEDINYAADGGLYAEQVQNRSFEHKDAQYAWSAVEPSKGSLSIQSSKPLNEKNPHFLQVDVRSRGFGVENSGWDGIPVKSVEKFLLSLWARAGRGFNGGLEASLVAPDGKVLAKTDLNGIGGDWKKLEGTLTGGGDASQAKLVLTPTGTGAVDLDMVSLFPENTFNKRQNGLRADLAEMLKDLNPGFMRFPGGCIVEGRDLANTYHWKETVGPIEERPQNWNRWQGDGEAPQYYQTYGLGFFEYFQLCEDIGAEPVPIVPSAMACQFQSGELVPMSDIGPWIQDALDLIEFANGPVTSKWGGLRAEMGHPEPFNLKMIGVGNEQWGPEYFKRYMPFYEAIKKAHPEIMVITTSGPGVPPNDGNWEFAWNQFRSGTPAEMVDEHFYRSPEWMLEHADRYDSYDRNGPKVFAGEYATHADGRRSNLWAALTEAAMMTGFERNADVVKMSAYAPLFAKEGHTQWRPDMIFFDNERVMPTPSYFTQSLFANNRPDVSLPVDVQMPDGPQPHGRIAVGTWDTQAEFKDVRVTKDGKTLFQSDFSKGMEGWETEGGQWAVRDAALVQSANGQPALAITGDDAWSDYTLELKARKTGGAEGFLIGFQIEDSGTKSWWNVGGWGNTESAIEAPGVAAPRVPGTIQTGRWYDLKIETAGNEIRCSLDGNSIQTVQRSMPKSLFVSAGREKDSGEVILKVVNVTNSPISTAVKLDGMPAGPLKGREMILTSESRNDENSLDKPDNVAPEEKALSVAGPSFDHTFPANSLSVLRLGKES